MEELLNKLIKGWWKPRWENEPIYMLSSKKLYIPDTMEVNRSLRDLVSKESGLWQFVCENWIIENWKKVHDYVIKLITYSDENHCWWYGMCNAEYYMMMSALCDEDKLEKFLLENIKIEWNEQL